MRPPPAVGKGGWEEAPQRKNWAREVCCADQCRSKVYTGTNRERKSCRCISPCSRRGSAFGGLFVATTLLGDCRMPAAVLLVAQACKSGVALLASQRQSPVIDPDKEAAAAEP